MKITFKFLRGRSITFGYEAAPKAEFPTRRIGLPFLLKVKIISRFRQKFGDGPCSVKFMGRRFYLPDYATFSSELTDIFVTNRDYFRADSEAPKIVDIGANVGLGTFYFKLLYPHAEIRNFEADPQTFSYLIKNTGGMEGVVSENNAVGDGKTKNLYRAATSISSTTTGGVLGGVGAEPVVVQGRKLSEILVEEIDLLKMDCEGAEFEIIKEAKNKLRMAKRIFMEVHVIERESIPAFLKTIEDSGFDVYIIETSMTHGQVLQGNHNYRMEIDCIRR